MAALGGISASRTRHPTRSAGSADDRLSNGTGIGTGAVLRRIGIGTGGAHLPSAGIGIIGAHRPSIGTGTGTIMGTARAKDTIDTTAGARLQSGGTRATPRSVVRTLPRLAPSRMRRSGHSPLRQAWIQEWTSGATARVCFPELSLIHI